MMLCLWRIILEDIIPQLIHSLTLFLFHSLFMLQQVSSSVLVSFQCLRVWSTVVSCSLFTVTVTLVTKYPSPTFVAEVEMRAVLILQGLLVAAALLGDVTTATGSGTTGSGDVRPMELNVELREFSVYVNGEVVEVERCHHEVSYCYPLHCTKLNSTVSCKCGTYSKICVINAPTHAIVDLLYFHCL